MSLSLSDDNNELLPEIWKKILFYIQPYEEYPLALVCRKWCAILRDGRDRRGEVAWRTWMMIPVVSVKMMQWARENSCPWDVRTCMNAAKGGHLAVLQWAHENGCPWDEQTCAYAA